MISMDKRYRTRDGGKVRLLCADRNGARPVIVLLEEAGEEVVTSYLSDGRWSAAVDSDIDLIEIPELEFDWSCLPKWANWITRDETNNKWFWWQHKPALVNGEYLQGRGHFGEIPPEFSPRYHGSNPAPIFQRPTEEGA